MASESSSHTLDLLRANLNREIDLLNERAREFLTFQSLLMAALAFGKGSLSLSFIVPLLGLATSLLWLYLGHRTLLMYGYFRDTVKRYELSVPEADKIFMAEEKFREEEHRPLLGIRVSSYFGYGLPIILISAWLALLALGI